MKGDYKLMRRAIAVLVALFVLNTAPVLAQDISADALATRDGEAQFGAIWLRQTRGKLGERIDPYCIDVLETWLIRLKNHVALGELPLTALCLGSREFNAFAAPGGIIGVNAGVYRDLASEAELMAILAHELAHLSQRHHYRGLRAQERISLGSIATLAGIFAAIATEQGQAAQSLIMGGQAASAQDSLRYSREFEREADRIGAVALADAGYDPAALSQVLKVLADKQSSLTTPLAFLSTHPLGIERQSDLDGRVARLAPKQAATPILSETDFQLFRCIQLEGLAVEGRLLNQPLCNAVNTILADYRAERYTEAYRTFQDLPSEAQQTLTGLDLRMALAIKAGDYLTAEDAIETFSVFFPSWLTPVIARVDLAIAKGESTLPRQFREASRLRPDRIDLWRALARFARANSQAHWLFEAQAWDALHHGQLDAARLQLSRAEQAWPTGNSRRPLERLSEAISAIDSL